MRSSSSSTGSSSTSGSSAKRSSRSRSTFSVIASMSRPSSSSPAGVTSLMHPLRPPLAASAALVSSDFAFTGASVSSGSSAGGSLSATTRAIAAKAIALNPAASSQWARSTPAAYAEADAGPNASTILAW